LTFSQITRDENLSICHFIDQAAHCLALDRTRFSAVVISVTSGSHTHTHTHTECLQNERASCERNLEDKYEEEGEHKI